ENVNVANPDIENLTVANPDIENPDIENPDIENPDIENPDIENGAIADVTWTVSNTGNTTSAFNVNLFLANAGVPAGTKTQLIVYKVYKTPVIDPNGCDLRTESRNLMLFNVPNPNFITPGQTLPNQNDPSDTNATLWLAPGEVGRVTLRVFDDDTSNNVIFTNLDGSTASIDPRFNPATVVTAGIAGQGVDVLDPLGATRPPVVTTTGTNLVYLQQPSTVLPGAIMTPPVSVRVYDNAGATLAGVQVALTLLNAPGAVLSGGLAASNASGIATFPALSISAPAAAASLRAAATSPGVVAAGTSAPFAVALPTIPAAVTITNFSSIFDGTPKSVNVATLPLGLATAVTYDGSPTAPAAIGAYLAQATVTSPGYAGSASAVLKVASTLAAGGGGGGPYQRYCGPGVFANGIAVSPANESLWNAQLRCSDSNHPPNFGNTDTPPFNTALTLLACPAGQVMVGLSGRSGPISWAPTADFMIAVAPRCQLPSGGAVTEPFLAEPGFAAGTPFLLDCPAGRAVTGVVGGSGAIVDSIALVCGALPAAPPTPTITSVNPAAQVAGFQMLTINGTSLPATGETDVLFNQGGPDITADYLWGASPTRVIARLQSGVLTPGAATTVRLKNPGNTVTSNAFPITISNTPGTPVFTSLLNQCTGGTSITTVNPGGPFAVEGDGIDTSGTSMVWTPISAGGSVITQSGTTSTGGPTGRVCSFFPTGAPAGLTTGTWNLQLQVQVGGFPSALSNGIVVTVP
ncbi:MAG: MBG domain-containing protein, partial [Acidobacteriota bacterium]